MALHSNRNGSGLPIPMKGSSRVSSIMRRSRFATAGADFFQ